VNGLSNDRDAYLAHCLAARALANELSDRPVRDGRVVKTPLQTTRPQCPSIELRSLYR
jgi:hypothetical protein